MKAGTLGKVTLLAAGAALAAMPLYALPATLSLPRGRRPGIEALTLEEAARSLRSAQAGRTHADLVEAARALVASRMQYCRRNSFDSPARAFERGYSYCTQQACALVELLACLGMEARAVYAFRNRLPDGKVDGHTWVRVTAGGEEWDIDSLFYDAERRQVTFAPLTKVRRHTRFFTWLTQWGTAGENARRYYRTGKDWE